MACLYSSSLDDRDTRPYTYNKFYEALFRRRCSARNHLATENSGEAKQPLGQLMLSIRAGAFLFLHERILFDTSQLIEMR